MVDVFSFGQITLLALVNSVNPCQIAMLILVLITIMTQNGEATNRKKILLTGFSFILAVYIGYLFYGIILIQLFGTFAGILKQSAVYVKDFFAVVSMLVGGLQIKDFFFYRPGGFATEMPIWMRAKAKRIIEKITSPFGAFITGFIITLFLGPCTITPMIIATESLAKFGILGALPWLLYFNLIIIVPLIIITLIIYKGITTAERISQWRERNIRIMHLIAGILLLGIGIAVLAGLF